MGAGSFGFRRDMRATRTGFNREIRQIRENNEGNWFACFTWFVVASGTGLLTNPRDAPPCLWQYPRMESDLLYKEESYKIVGACFEVYREMGCGFLEAVYQECLEIELRLQGVPSVPKKSLTLEYKGSPLRAFYEPDFICHDKIVLELKAATELTDEHR